MAFDFAVIPFSVAFDSLEAGGTSSAILFVSLEVTTADSSSYFDFDAEDVF